MKSADKRAQAFEAILSLLLAEGLENTGIRKLAKAGGISDRMLIYYFGSKDALMAEALTQLTERTTIGLNLLVGEGQHEAAHLIEVIEGALAIPQFDEAMRLFVEVAARAGRGIEPYRTVARDIIDAWEAWLTERLLQVPGGPTPHDLLVQIEGEVLVRLIRTD